MQLSDFDYELPKDLIAQGPQRPRDHSRLLVLDAKSKKIEHKLFYQIVDYLEKGDVLVLNNTKVMRARLIGHKQTTGGQLEIFLLKKIKSGLWQCLIGGHGRHEGQNVLFEQGLQAEILADNHDGTWQVKFNLSSGAFLKVIDQIGLVPLPPYIKRDATKQQTDNEDYQTIFAADKKVGSVAAPTAGLHFTPALIKQLKTKGVKFEYVTLQVGLGTFASVKTQKITEHKMHAEWAEADQKTLARIVAAKKAGAKIVAVGTTSARTLESIFNNQSQVLSGQRYGAWTDIFIYPGYEFKMVDELITNFHVPKSTLMMLVSALAGAPYKNKAIGIKIIKKAYAEAILNKYRFLSYGDAMFIKCDKK